MAFREQTNVSQPGNEPARRLFHGDGGHFSLLVWYLEPNFRSIVGFQLGFKPNPFNTDDEYFLTLRPNSKMNGIELLRTNPKDVTIAAAPKMLEEMTDGTLPPALKTTYARLASSLPGEVRSFLESHAKQWLGTSA